MLFPILTIVGGLIAASSLILAKKPDAARVFEKIAPYQGLLGLGMLALGVVWLLDVLPQITAVMTSVYGILALAAIALNIVIGFLLSFGLLSRFALSKSSKAEATGRQLVARLAPVQAPLGVAATVVGTLALFL